MKNEVICNSDIRDIVPAQVLSYDESLRLAFDHISRRAWYRLEGCGVQSTHQQTFSPIRSGCPEAQRAVPMRGRSPSATILSASLIIWRIGGDQGWYFGNWMCASADSSIRWWVVLKARRGRRSATDLKPAMPGLLASVVGGQGRRQAVVVCRDETAQRSVVGVQDWEVVPTGSCARQLLSRPLGLWGGCIGIACCRSWGDLSRHGRSGWCLIDFAAALPS